MWPPGTVPGAAVAFDIDRTLTSAACDADVASAACGSHQGALLRMLALARTYGPVSINTARRVPTLMGVPPEVRDALLHPAAGPPLVKEDIKTFPRDKATVRTRHAVALQKVDHLVASARRWGLPRDRVVLVDDNVHNLDAAREHGFATVRVSAEHGADDGALRRLADVLRAGHSAQSPALHASSNRLCASA